MRGLGSADTRDRREREIAREEVGVVAVHARDVSFLLFFLRELAFVEEEGVQLSERLIALLYLSP